MSKFLARHPCGDIIQRAGRLTLLRRPGGGVIGAVVVFEDVNSDPAERGVLHRASQLP